jgi:hypothetical protein
MIKSNSYFFQNQIQQQNIKPNSNNESIENINYQPSQNNE